MIQDNLKTLITDEVNLNQRVYKIIDGTQPLKTAHVFHRGVVTNRGNSDEDLEKMGEEAHVNYCEWYAKNRNIVQKYYESKDV